MSIEYQHDTERFLRSQSKIYALRGNLQMARNFELCADDVKKLRMAVDLHQQGAEHMREELAKVKAELAALKKAAKGLLAIHKRHKGLTVYSEQDYRDIWSERVELLAALVGEE